VNHVPLERRDEEFMSTAEQENLKQVVKDAIREAFTENREMVKELLAEVVEDIALLHRMEEGRDTDLVSRDQIMQLLEPKH
jgi:hypothetical protein